MDMSILKSERECTASHIHEEYQTISLPKILYPMANTSVAIHQAYRGKNGDQ